MSQSIMESDSEDEQSPGPAVLFIRNQTAVKLGVMFKDAEFTDVTLFGMPAPPGETPLQPVRAHKVVLAAGSEFFRALFTKNNVFADSSKNKVTLETVKHDSLKLALEAMYTGMLRDARIRTDVNVACDLLEAAKYLLMEDLALECEKVLIRHHLNVASCFTLWEFALKYRPMLSSLNAGVENFLEKSLEALMPHESFLRLPAEALVRMMRIVSNVKSTKLADERFRAAFAWLEYDTEYRRLFSDDILNTILSTPGKISNEALAKACNSNALTPESTKKLLRLVGESLTVCAAKLSSCVNSVVTVGGGKRGTGGEAQYIRFRIVDSDENVVYYRATTNTKIASLRESYADHLGVSLDSVSFKVNRNRYLRQALNDSETLGSSGLNEEKDQIDAVVLQQRG